MLQFLKQVLSDNVGPSSKRVVMVLFAIVSSFVIVWAQLHGVDIMANVLNLLEFGLGGSVAGVVISKFGEKKPDAT